MSGLEILGFGAQALFLSVAIYVAVHTYFKPTRSNLYVLTFFALLALIITYAWIQRVAEVAPGGVAEYISPILVLLLPYVLLRLAREYTSVRQRYIRLAEVGLIASTALVLTGLTEQPIFLFLIASYFAIVAIYAASRFQTGATFANGITQKRLRSLSIASILLGISLFTVPLTAVFNGGVSSVIEVTRQALLMASALLYLVGFSPPRLVRQAWQEPELRRFLRRTLRLPRWSNQDEALRHIEEATAETIGAPNASIGLWDPQSEFIVFRNNRFKPGQTIGGQAFLERQPILSLDSIADDPENREIYERGNALAVVAAPIQTEDRMIGVIALYAPNPPIFADDDLSLLELLADQIGVLLENREYLEAQTELAAREETTRLKDEFLSVAAHDLKTPLTTILATGQYLERRLAMSGDDSPEMRSIVRLNREARRLRSLVQGLLDASRIERGQLLTSVELTDISELVRDVVTRLDSHTSHAIETEISEPLLVDCDPVRIQQVIENLLENAQKYSPDGSTIHVRASGEGDEALIAVTDQGIGISPEEQQHVFDRYYRSPNAGDSEAPGIGLGLYICKAIIDQHGGDLWVESRLGEGSTFSFSLQRSAVAAKDYGAVNTRSG